MGWGDLPYPPGAASGQGKSELGPDRLAPLTSPHPCGWKMPPPLVPGLRKPHTLTSHSLPRRSFVFFPSRGFLWGWALWGYSFLLGRGCASGKGPSSAFCPSEPLRAPASSPSLGYPRNPPPTVSHPPHPQGCLSSLVPRGSCPHCDSLVTPISIALCGLASVFLLVSLLFS